MSFIYFLGVPELPSDLQADTGMCPGPGVSSVWMQFASLLPGQVGQVACLCTSALFHGDNNFEVLDSKYQA